MRNALRGEKAKIQLHFKMTFFNDSFLMKKNVCKYTNYSLKNVILRRRCILAFRI